MQRITRYMKIGWLIITVMISAIPALTATNSFSVVNSGFTAYVINGVNNPDLTLVRGYAYSFNVNASGHPFWIKTIQGNTTANAYNDGVTNNGTSSGVLQFNVPLSAPSLLFYNCQFHSSMTGRLFIIDPPDIVITGIEKQADVVLTSTGSDALNVKAYTRPDLTSGSWLPVPIQNNAYSDGTNITHVAQPVGSAAFFLIRQDLP